MSIRSLCLAVSEQIQSTLTLDDTRIGIRTTPGRPPAVCGDEYISVVPDTWSPGPSNDQNDAFDEYFGFSIVVTQRSAYIPDDTIGEDLFLKEEGLEPRLRRIVMTLMANKWIVLSQTNSYLSGNPFTETYRFLGADTAPTPVGSEWFGSMPKPGSTSDFGYTLKATFGEARRLQSHADIRSYELDQPST